MHFTVKLQPQTTFLYNKTLFRSLIFTFKSSCDGNNLSVKLSDIKTERIHNKTSQAALLLNRILCLFCLICATWGANVTHFTNKFYPFGRLPGHRCHCRMWWGHSCRARSAQTRRVSSSHLNTYHSWIRGNEDGRDTGRSRDHKHPKWTRQKNRNILNRRIIQIQDSSWPDQILWLA